MNESIPKGYCQCGCGSETEVAPKTRTEMGWVKGKPKPYFGMHRTGPSFAERKAYLARRKAERPDISYGRCYCGCGEVVPIAKTTVRGHGRDVLLGEPIRYCPGHIRQRRGPDYVVEPETGCWLWCHPVAPGTGYGYVWLGAGKVKSAHRFYYEKRYGLIGQGMHLHHVCRQRKCVNPEHLKPVKPSEHVRTHAQLSWEDVENIRLQLPKNAREANHMARQYGVTVYHIRSIVNNDRWKR